ASFRLDGKRVLTASRDHTVRLWELERGTDTPSLVDSPVAHAELSRDGKLVVTAAMDKTARIWDKFEEALDSEPLRLEPYAKLRECVLGLGAPLTRVEARLEKALGSGGEVEPSLWDFWFRMAAAEMQLDAKDLLALLPPVAGDDRRGDLRWILQEILSKGR